MKASWVAVGVAFAMIVVSSVILIREYYNGGEL